MARLHPNQLALVDATEKWIEQSQALSDDVAVDRLTDNGDASQMERAA